MMKLEENGEYLHVDGSIHKVIDIQGAAAYVQVYKDSVCTGEYSTDVGDGVIWDTELAGSLTPLTR